MNYEHFRDVDELTHDEIIAQEIDEIVHKKDSSDRRIPKRRSEDVKEQKTEEIKTEPTKSEPEKKEVEVKSNVRKQEPDRSKPKKVVKKNVIKKTVKKQHTQKPKTIIIEDDEPESKWLTVIVSAIAILAIVVVAYLLYDTATTQTQETSTVAAIVNGVPIYNSDVDMRLNMLRNTGNIFATRDQALEDTITQELLSQKAKKEGYTVSEKEIEETLTKELEANGFTKEELESNLAESGLKFEDLIKFYSQNLLVLQYMNETVLSKVILAEDEPKKYYDENKDSFIQDAQVTVKHILVGYGNQSDNETFATAKTIESEIKKDKSNYCDLVKEFTDDIGSKETCGEYTFSETDPLVPEFIEAGFDMKKDELRIVKTQFGYHIMLKVKDIPKQTLSFEAVKDSIITILEREQVMNEYEEIITTLRDEAIIEIYTEEGQLVESEKANQTTISTESVKETVKTKEAEKQELTKCLESKGAKMYTVYWNPDNEAQLEIFGEDAQYIDIVECDPEGKDTQQEECQKLGVNIYPSWIVDGELIEGLQSLRSLKTATGC